MKLSFTEDIQKTGRHSWWDFHHVISSYFKYLFWSARHYGSFIFFLVKRMPMKMAGNLRATKSEELNLAFKYHRKVYSIFFWLNSSLPMLINAFKHHRKVYSMFFLTQRRSLILIKTSSSEMSHLVTSLKILSLGARVQLTWTCKVSWGLASVITNLYPHIWTPAI